MDKVIYRGRFARLIFIPVKHNKCLPSLGIEDIMYSNKLQYNFSKWNMSYFSQPCCFRMMAQYIFAVNHHRWPAHCQLHYASLGLANLWFFDAWLLFWQPFTSFMLSFILLPLPPIHFHISQKFNVCKLLIYHLYSFSKKKLKREPFTDMVNTNLKEKNRILFLRWRHGN